MKIAKERIMIIFIWIIIIFINFIIIAGLQDNIQEYFFEFELMVLVITTLALSVRKNGILSETTIFVLSMIFFLCIRPIENLFGIVDILDGRIISYSYNMSDKTYITVLNCLLVAMLSIYMAISVFQYNVKEFELSDDYRPVEANVASKLFYICILVSIPYKLYLGSIVSLTGYGSIFNRIGVSSIMTISSYANSFVFASFISSFILGDTRANMKYKIFVYVLWSLLGVLSGKRTTVIVPLLFSVWFYNRYIKPVKLRYIVFILFIALLVNSITLQIRGIATSSLDGNGGSVYVIGLTIDNADILNSAKCNEWGIPYSFGVITKDAAAIIYKVLGLISPYSEGQSLSTLLHSSYLGWELTYLISPNSFLTGYGTGSSYIAEAYLSYGYAGIIFFTVLVFWLVARMGRTKSIPGTSLYFVMISSFFAAPRNSFFNFLISWICIVFLCWSINLVCSLPKGGKLYIRNSRY